MKGKFITFEGCEGVGKSTQVRFLREYLDKQGIEYVFVREPGSTSIGEKIREIILDANNALMTPECEALLYASCRAQLLGEVILPAIEQGKLVICDRYIDSSLAYQAFARGLGEEFVSKVNCFAFEKGVPDLTIFLDLSPEITFKRKGGASADRIEQSGMEFHLKVYKGYKAFQREYPERIVSIDPSADKYTTHEKIKKLLSEKGLI